MQGTPAVKCRKMVQATPALTLAADVIVQVELASQFANALTAICTVGHWGGLVRALGSLVAGGCEAGVSICSKTAMKQAHCDTVWKHCIDQPQRLCPALVYGSQGPSDTVTPAASSDSLYLT